MSTAVIQPLRKRFLNARLTFLVGSGAEGILAGDISIDAVRMYDNRGNHAGMRGKYRLITSLLRERFDLVIDLRDSFWSRFIGAPRWGISLRGHNIHAVTRYLNVLERHGVDTNDAEPRLTLSKTEVKAADNFLAAHRFNLRNRLIGIHPGGNWEYKLWPAEYFARIGDMLQADLHAQVLLFAGPDESGLQKEVASMMKRQPIIVKENNLRHVAVLISRCTLYLGNDTGTTHIAAAVGTPVVAIFGSTNHLRSGPYGAQHSVVRSNIDFGCNPCHPGKHPGGCQHNRCPAMEAITVEQVWETISSYLVIG